MKKIVAMSGGGTGNRFFGLLTAYYFAHRTNSILNIYWQRDLTMGAMWSDLFEIDSSKVNICDVDPKIVKFEDEDSFWITHLPESEFRGGAQVMTPFPTNEEYQQVDDYYVQRKSADEILDIINSIDDDRTIVITDCNPTILSNIEYADGSGQIPWSENYDPVQVVKDFFKDVFVINKDIMDKAEEFCRKNDINEQTVGFHFRSINLGYIDLGHASYIIEEAISSGAEKIFLCADNEEAEDVLSRQWSGHVITYKKRDYMRKADENSPWDLNVDDMGYNESCSRAQCIDALVDCVILSKTNTRSLLMETCINQPDPWPGSFYLMANYIKEYSK